MLLLYSFWSLSIYKMLVCVYFYQVSTHAIVLQTQILIKKPLKIEPFCSGFKITKNQFFQKSFMLTVTPLWISPGNSFSTLFIPVRSFGLPSWILSWLECVIINPLIMFPILHSLIRLKCVWCSVRRRSYSATRSWNSNENFFDCGGCVIIFWSQNSIFIAHFDCEKRLLNCNKLQLWKNAIFQEIKYLAVTLCNTLTSSTEMVRYSDAQTCSNP